MLNLDIDVCACNPTFPTLSLVGDQRQRRSSLHYELLKKFEHVSPF